jgi:hypothetical protein
MDYLQLTSLSRLPELSALRPYKAIIIVEDSVAPDRQAQISQWLIASGCLYTMAWGPDCRSWTEAVDLANREAFDTQAIPSESLVMTTWHEDESLAEVFWFSKHTAMHPCSSLANTLVLHLSPTERQAELAALYEAA